MLVHKQLLLGLMCSSEEVTGWGISAHSRQQTGGALFSVVVSLQRSLPACHVMDVPVCLGGVQRTYVVDVPCLVSCCLPLVTAVRCFPRVGVDGGADGGNVNVKNPWENTVFLRLYAVLSLHRPEQRLRIRHALVSVPTCWYVVLDDSTNVFLRQPDSQTREAEIR